MSRADIASIHFREFCNKYGHEIDNNNIFLGRQAISISEKIEKEIERTIESIEKAEERNYTRILDNGEYYLDKILRESKEKYQEMLRIIDEMDRAKMINPDANGCYKISVNDALIHLPRTEENAHLRTQLEEFQMQIKLTDENIQELNSNGCNISDKQFIIPEEISAKPSMDGGQYIAKATFLVNGSSGINNDNNYFVTFNSRNEQESKNFNFRIMSSSGEIFGPFKFDRDETLTVPNKDFEISEDFIESHPKFCDKNQKLINRVEEARMQISNDNGFIIHKPTIEDKIIIHEQNIYVLNEEKNTQITYESDDTSPTKIKVEKNGELYQTNISEVKENNALLEQEMITNRLQSIINELGVLKNDIIENENFKDIIESLKEHVIETQNYIEEEIDKNKNIDRLRDFEDNYDKYSEKESHDIEI